MSEITSTLGSATPRHFRVRRGRLTCVAGADAGRSWLVDGEIIRIGQQQDNDIALADETVSRRHAEVVRIKDGVVLRDLGSTNGTFVGPVKIREVYLAPDTRFRVGQTELVFATADELVVVTPSMEHSFEDMVGSSMAMRELFGFLEKVAPTNLTVLVSGETGTGKELVSRALHSRSNRAHGPFVVFDCGAVSRDLVESELFGHEKGSFTGAVAGRPGVFELADGGTLLLDEVGELPVELQPKLLRALEQREVRRVGSARVQRVDVRVVAATNRDLRQEVQAGRFRDDLYYRLAVVELELPPLRRRVEDLPRLVEHFLQLAPHNPGVTGVSAEVLDLLRDWSWPGNVRELKNMVERALPFSSSPVLAIADLPHALRAADDDAPPPADGESISQVPFKDAKERMVDGFERQYLLDLLARHDGNVTRAARAAGMDRKSISRLLKKHGISR